MTDVIDVYLPPPLPSKRLNMITGPEDPNTIELGLLMTEGPPGLWEVIPEPPQDNENAGLFTGLYLPFEDGLLTEDPPGTHLYFHPALGAT